MTKKPASPKGNVEATVLRELMQKLRINEMRYLEQASAGGLPKRRDVIEASIASLMEIRRAFAKLGGFQYGNLPVHLKILFDELGTVHNGTPSRLFATTERRTRSNQVSPRTRFVRAHSAVLVDLLMDKTHGPGWPRRTACCKVAEALKRAGFGTLSGETIRDWRKEASSESSHPTFQMEYEISKAILMKQVRDGKSPHDLLDELPVHIRAHIFE